MLKILIAEDDRELRQLFSHVLGKNGYIVKGVGNGREALDALDAEYYDLIISDIMMPVMDGYELVRQLRESGSTAPVMMITAKGEFSDMQQGFLTGSDDYMVKPINVNEMDKKNYLNNREEYLETEKINTIDAVNYESVYRYVRKKLKK